MTVDNPLGTFFLFSAVIQGLSALIRIKAMRNEKISSLTNHKSCRASKKATVKTIVREEISILYVLSISLLYQAVYPLAREKTQDS